MNGNETSSMAKKCANNVHIWKRVRLCECTVHTLHCSRTKYSVIAKNEIDYGFLLKQLKVKIVLMKSVRMETNDVSTHNEAQKLQLFQTVEKSHVGQRANTENVCKVQSKWSCTHVPTHTHRIECRWNVTTKLPTSKRSRIPCYSFCQAVITRMYDVRHRLTGHNYDICINRFFFLLFLFFTFSQIHLFITKKK